MSKRLKKFMACSHKNVQQFTEMCLDCGENIYTTASKIKKEEEEKKEGQNLKKKKVCQHKNVQQFTGMCLDCDENVF